MNELYEKLRNTGDPRDKLSAYVLACYENTEAKKSGKDNK